VTDARPGMKIARLARLVTAAVERCQLDLGGFVVLTEAATGPYVVTPILAAVAGAECVHAVTRATRYGSVDEVTQQTYQLADAMGVSRRIRVSTEKTTDIVGRADIVTNSGHLRPLDAITIARMKPSAVIPLMYEAWELRPGEVDLAACRVKGIQVAGTNERHPDVDVLSYLGVMATKLLADSGVAVYGSRVLVVCDNPFAPFLRSGLEAAGSQVQVVTELDSNVRGEPPDAILLAVKPRARPVIGDPEAAQIAASWPGTVLAQLWGEIDRDAAAANGLACWPSIPPAPGHMGILPSAIGPEPIVRLQAGGLKVGEVLLRGGADRGKACWEYVDAI
jgi:hypothetical protein